MDPHDLNLANVKTKDYKMDQRQTKDNQLEMDPHDLNQANGSPIFFLITRIATLSDEAKLPGKILWGTFF